MLEALDSILSRRDRDRGADQMGLLDSQSYLYLLLAVILTENLKSICPLVRLEERKKWFVCSS